MADLVAGLGPERARLGPARKALERLARRAAPVAAPLPDRIAARKARQAGCAPKSQGLAPGLPCLRRPPLPFSQQPTERSVAAHAQRSAQQQGPIGCAASLR